MLRFLTRHSAAILVVLALGLALFLRVVAPFPLVFTESGVRFVEADPYSHMRLVDNTLAHFPTRTPFDPYTYYPEGAPVYYPPLFTLFVSGVVWLFSFGSPTPVSTDVIAALFPAVLGSLTVIPVFFLGKALFNKWAGVLAALLMAIMPGEVLGRSIVGFTDHHVVEFLFTATSLMFLVLAIKALAQVSFKPFVWQANRKPLLLAVLSGVFLGLYLQMWAGGPIFVLVLIGYFIIQSVLDHLRGKRPAGFALVATAAMLTASLITLPFLPRHYSPPLYFLALGGATVAPAALAAISRLLSRTRLPRLVFPAGLVALGVGALVVLRLANAGLFNSLAASFNILSPSAQELTINEVAPLFFPGGKFSLSVVWLNFSTGFVFALITLGIIIYQQMKHDAPERTLLIVWSLCMLGLTLAQRRFAYYYAVNVSILTAGLAWFALKWVGLEEVLTPGRSTTQAADSWKKSLRGRQTGAGGPPKVYTGLVLAGVILMAVAPNIPPAIKTVSQLPFAPDAAWTETLTWLRDNSPAPFGDHDLYYEVVEKPNPGQNYAYPDSAYGVMAWWDYGHWITRIAHRLPNHAPGGGRSPKVAQALLAQDEKTAEAITEELDSLYVIADYTTAVYALHGVATFAGKDRSDYFDVYYQEQNGVVKPVTVLFPEYYRTLLARLYFFDGKAVTPEKSTVITWEDRRNTDGSPYRLVTDVLRFTTYGEAENYIAGRPGQNLRIVSTDPFSSPVPLEALDHYRLVYRSISSSTPGSTRYATPVKVFVYVGGNGTMTASNGGNEW